MEKRPRTTSTQLVATIQRPAMHAQTRYTIHECISERTILMAAFCREGSGQTSWEEELPTRHSRAWFDKGGSVDR